MKQYLGIFFFVPERLSSAIVTCRRGAVPWGCCVYVSLAGLKMVWKLQEFVNSKCTFECWLLKTLLYDWLGRHKRAKERESARVCVCRVCVSCVFCTNNLEAVMDCNRSGIRQSNKRLPINVSMITYRIEMNNNKKKENKKKRTRTRRRRILHSWQGSFQQEQSPQKIKEKLLRYEVRLEWYQTRQLPGYGRLTSI